MKFAFISLLCSFLILIPEALFCQDILSTNNRWSVTTTSWWQGPNTTTKIQRLSQPIHINGFNYQRILESNDSLNMDWQSTGFYLRADSTSKVFLFFNGQESILYDFNLVLGDTFEVNEFCNLLVTSVDSVMLLNGTSRKRISLETIEEINTQPIIWIEGIGNDQGLSHYFTCESASFSLKLICFKEEEELLYPLDSESCFIDITNTTEPKDGELIKVFPTIFDKTIKVSIEDDYEALTMELISVSGSLISRSQLTSPQTNIDLSFLSQGLYMLRVLKNGQVVYSRKVIKN